MYFSWSRIMGPLSSSDGAFQRILRHSAVLVTSKKATWSFMGKTKSCPVHLYYIPRSFPNPRMKPKLENFSFLGPALVASNWLTSPPILADHKIESPIEYRSITFFQFQPLMMPKAPIQAFVLYHHHQVSTDHVGIAGNWGECHCFTSDIDAIPWTILPDTARLSSGGLSCFSLCRQARSSKAGEKRTASVCNGQRWGPYNEGEIW